jgi:iron complex transport system permease protein
LFFLALGLLALTALGAVRGRVEFLLSDLWILVKAHLWGPALPDSPAYRQMEVVVFSIRLPRIFLSILVGGALSVSGAVYQNLFRNPMVAPDILGVSSGAGVGASLAIVIGFPSPLIHLTAFVFGLSAVFLVVTISQIAGHNRSLVVMILVGVVVSSLFSAFGSFLKYISSDDQSLTNIVLWLMGSFAQASSWTNVLILLGVTILAYIPLFFVSYRINALAFGEEEASSMGVNVSGLKIIIILCATLMTATATAICGLIGWVGLLIPHLCRFIVGPNFQILLPTSLLAGGLFMLLVDSLVRLVFPGEMPVGIITSLAGAPLFIYVLCRSTLKWN